MSNDVFIESVTHIYTEGETNMYTVYFLHDNQSEKTAFNVHALGGSLHSFDQLCSIKYERYLSHGDSLPPETCSWERLVGYVTKSQPTRVGLNKSCVAHDSWRHLYLLLGEMVGETQDHSAWALLLVLEDTLLTVPEGEPAEICIPWISLVWPSFSKTWAFTFFGTDKIDLQLSFSFSQERKCLPKIRSESFDSVGKTKLRFRGENILERSSFLAILRWRNFPITFYFFLPICHRKSCVRFKCALVSTGML